MTSVKQLHEEYEQAICVQKQVIAANLRRLRKALKSYDHAEVKRINSILAVLYDEKRELEERTRELSKYIS